MNQNIEEIKQKITPILEKYGVKRAGIFGSCVRGEAKDHSDVDILIEVGQDINLLDFIGIKLEIEEMLDRKVDLVEYDTIKPLIRETVLREQIPIYG
jgi:predicted nucleotidyltransferase